MLGRQGHDPAALPLGNRLSTNCIGGCVGLGGRSGRAQKISLSPGFDFRTVQPVACRYTN